MRKIYTTLFLVFPLFIWAQQDAQFTQFMHNRIFYNPGVAGSGGAICLNALHRIQWVGFDGAPQTTNFNANIPIAKIKGGIGVGLFNEQIGFFQETGGALSYAYQLQLPGGTLGLGLGATFMNKSVNNAAWIAPDDFGGGMGSGFLDPSIAAGDASGFLVDMQFGAYYQATNFWVGLSSFKLLQMNSEVDSRVRDYLPAGGGVSTTLDNSRHFYLMGGYNYQLPSSNWSLQPSALVKINNSVTADVNLAAVYNNRLWGGVTYRLQDAVAVNLGYQITPELKAGYSYDVTTSELSAGSGGSHEFMVQYCFKIEIPPKVPGSYKNPRFL